MEVNRNWEQDSEMNDIVKAIDNSPSVALITHINPDGDAIGSTLALMHALDKIGNLGCILSR